MLFRAKIALRSVCDITPQLLEKLGVCGLLLDIDNTLTTHDMTVQDKADSFSTLADANKAEYQIGAQLGSIQADLAKENTPDADIVEPVRPALSPDSGSEPPSPPSSRRRPHSPAGQSAPGRWKR